jgi:hypothetical protein
MQCERKRGISVDYNAFILSNWNIDWGWYFLRGRRLQEEQVLDGFKFVKLDMPNKYPNRDVKMSDLQHVCMCVCVCVCVFGNCCVDIRATGVDEIT